jgi:hypothetical protein
MYRESERLTRFKSKFRCSVIISAEATNCVRVPSQLTQNLPMNNRNETHSLARSYGSVSREKRKSDAHGELTSSFSAPFNLENCLWELTRELRESEHHSGMIRTADHLSPRQVRLFGQKRETRDATGDLLGCRAVRDGTLKV